MSLPPDELLLVRRFSANGYKYLFRRGENVADLLRWREPTLASRIDFAQMQVQPDTFVAPDFTALESDVLLRAPFRAGRGKRVEVFVLIENQSEPDPLMPFRVLRYVILIYEQQADRWKQLNGNLHGLQFDPVLPIVFYSGRRRWDGIGTFSALVRGAKLFGKRVPQIEPLFIDLARAEPSELKTDVGMLGWVLWLSQQSQLKRSAFGDVLRQTVARLDSLPKREHDRWRQLLWYAHALVYHKREGGERDQCAEYIRETVSTAHQAEVSEMGKTIREMTLEEGMEKGMEKGMEQGELRGQQNTLITCLRAKFEKVPASIEATIHATKDREKLDCWVREVLRAEKLSDISFNP